MSNDMLTSLKSPTPDRPILTTALSARDLGSEALVWAEGGVTVRAVRGAKASTVPALFDEFAAALQFPYYFGENWAAFDECLADLDWLPLTSGMAIAVYDADQLLRDASSTDVATFFKILARAAEELSEPVTDGEWWDRPGIAFHLVLQLQDENVWPWSTGQDLRADR